MSGPAATPTGTPTAARPPFAVALFMEAAQRLGLAARVVDPEFGYLWELEWPDGHRRTLIGAKTPINDASAAQVCGDKHYASMVLERAGLRVPEAVRCLSPVYFARGEFADRTGPAPGVAFAERAGFPLVVKPNKLSHGRSVRFAWNEAELLAAIDEVFERDTIALVQRPASGREFRLDFLDGEFLVGYERAPLVVEGDGTRTLGELLAAADPRFEAADSRDARRAEIATTEAFTERRAANDEFGFDTPLASGERIDFARGVLNLNRCATGRLVETLPAPWLAWAQRVGRALALRLFGIDLRVESLDADPHTATIIEVNSAPLVNQIARMGQHERAVEAQRRVLAALRSNDPTPCPPPESR